MTGNNFLAFPLLKVHICPVLTEESQAPYLAIFLWQHYVKCKVAQAHLIHFLLLLNTDLLQSSIVQVYAQAQLYLLFLLIQTPRAPFNNVPQTPDMAFWII